MTRSPSTQIVHREPHQPVEWLPAQPTVVDVEWEKLWLVLQRRPWRTLALVPSGAGVPAGFTIDIANALIRIGSKHLGMPIRIADATRVSLAQLVQFLNQVRGVVEAGDLVLLALGPVQQSSTTVALAQAADEALLCVPLNQTKMSSVRRTIDEIGAQHFLGTITVKV